MNWLSRRCELIWWGVPLNFIWRLAMRRSSSLKSFSWSRTGGRQQRNSGKSFNQRKGTETGDQRLNLVEKYRKSSCVDEWMKTWARSFWGYLTLRGKFTPGNFIFFCSLFTKLSGCTVLTPRFNTAGGKTHHSIHKYGTFKRFVRTAEVRRNLFSLKRFFFPLRQVQWNSGAFLWATERCNRQEWKAAAWIRMRMRMTFVVIILYYIQAI